MGFESKGVRDVKKRNIILDLGKMAASRIYVTVRFVIERAGSSRKKETFSRVDDHQALLSGAFVMKIFRP